MALDAATIELLAQELDAALADSRIDKIASPTKDEIVFNMRAKQNFKLFISARSGAARVCVTDEVFENPAVPPNFCMLLRKHLQGGRFISATAQHGERVILLKFRCTGELGDLVDTTLAVELLGRYSNLVLINEQGKILDALKRVSIDDSAKRPLFNGLAYTVPPPQNKKYFLDFDADELASLLPACDGLVSAALLQTTAGIGPALCAEIAYLALAGQDPFAATLTQAQLKDIALATKTLQHAHAAGGQPIAVYDGQTPREFSFLKLSHYGSAVNYKTFTSFSALLNAYYSEKDKQERMRQKNKELVKHVQNLYNRALRKQAQRTDEQAEGAKSEQLRIYGELLQANLHAINKGDKAASVLNYYDGTTAQIPLDIRLTPAANAQKYFKEYKKKQTAAKMLQKLLAEGEHEIAYLDTVLYEIKQAQNETELEAIRAELYAARYLKSYKPREKRPKPQDFLRYTSSDGLLILVGRNNVQNEKLTMKTARGKDLWFHVKSGPGSHTVIISEGQDIPLQTKNEAAMLALYHSSLAASAKVAVDYTEVRNIKKTADLKTGMVIYDNYETAYVTVDEAALPKRIEA